MGNLWATEHTCIPQVKITGRWMDKQYKKQTDRKRKKDKRTSSLHWPIQSFLYAFFIQWSILGNSKNFLPYPSPPPPHFERPKYPFICSNAIFLPEHFQTVHCSFISPPKKNSLSVSKRGKESEWNLLPHQKKCYFYSPFYVFSFNYDVTNRKH